MRIGAHFEPRVVRAPQDPSRSIDNSCVPSQSPTQSRGAGGVGGRSVSAQRYTPSIPPLPNATPVSFSRPTYLDHSALRDFLVTETSSPTLAELAFPRKITPSARSTSPDSGEDTTPSPPPTRETRVMSAPVVHEGPVTYALPTRWSDQARSNSLSVSHDGRELSHHGMHRVEESFLGNGIISEFCNLGANNNSDKEHAANARANHPVPPACGIYYYEVEVRCKEQKRYVKS